MEVKPIHIVLAGVFAFAAIVAANMISQFQSDENFRERFSNFDFTSIRKQRVAEELMTVPDSDEAESD